MSLVNSYFVMSDCDGMLIYEEKKIFLRASDTFIQLITFENEERESMCMHMCIQRYVWMT